MAKVALLAGSTGLIGGQLLELLLTDNHYDIVIAISRKPLSIKNPKLVNIVCELRDLEKHHDQLKAHDVFCCLGTTIKKAKSKDAFRAVDLDAPLLLAKNFQGTWCAKNFCLCPSWGANKNSGVFYNKVKGEVEEAIKQVEFDRLDILRPSLLLGPRQEERSGEDAAKSFLNFLDFSSLKNLKLSNRQKLLPTPCINRLALSSPVFSYMNRIRSEILNEQTSLLVLVMAMAAVSGNSQSNFSLSGKVIDSKTKEPVPFATIFFASTMLGTTSKEDGSYRIEKYSIG